MRPRPENLSHVEAVKLARDFAEKVKSGQYKRTARPALSVLDTMTEAERMTLRMATKGETIRGRKTRTL
jgi:hypothetical protein